MAGIKDAIGIFKGEPMTFTYIGRDEAAYLRRLRLIAIQWDMWEEYFRLVDLERLLTEASRMESLH